VHICTVAKQLLLISPEIMNLSSELVSSGVELYLHSKTKRLGACFLVTAMLLDVIPTGSEALFQALAPSLGTKSQWGSCTVPGEEGAGEVLGTWRDKANRVMRSNRSFRRACGGREFVIVCLGLVGGKLDAQFTIFRKL
jgi:hypothetical protein